ncbi:MAG: 30S ribosomal protein S12 methylthiotransferase RimO, partial [Clostridia bacterium]|nr:30S ribosomal protein S12 methylthiotransferase RimO [Clostridia bacterium]
YVGKTLEVVCDEIDFENSCFVGRAYFQAPEIDGVVYFTAQRAETGKTYIVKIERTNAYDLYGSATEE